MQEKSSSVDSQEARDKDFMQDWGFADEGNQSALKEPLPVDESNVSAISSIQGNNHQAVAQGPYGVAYPVAVTQV